MARRRERLAPCDLTAFPPDAAARLGAPGLARRRSLAAAGGSSPKASNLLPCCAPGYGGWKPALGRRRCAPRHRFIGFDESGDLIAARGPQGRLVESAGAIVLACGGASWPRLGSDGAWVAALRAGGIEITPLQPANCGFDVGWSSTFIERFAGAPLKTIAMSFAGRQVRGEGCRQRRQGWKAAPSMRCPRRCARRSTRMAARC